MPECWTQASPPQDSASFLVDKVLATSLPETVLGSDKKFLWDMKQPFRLKAVSACSLDTPRVIALKDKGSKTRIEV
jgi:hypothetical protein